MAISYEPGLKMQKIDIDLNRCYVRHWICVYVWVCVWVRVCVTSVMRDVPAMLIRCHPNTTGIMTFVISDFNMSHVMGNIYVGMKPRPIIIIGAVGTGALFVVS